MLSHLNVLGVTQAAVWLLTSKQANYPLSTLSHAKDACC